MPESVRAALTDKLARTMKPEKGDLLETLNRFLFGLMSPNTALLPNEAVYARIRIKSEAEARKWAAMLPVNPTKEQRAELDRRLRSEFGLTAKSPEDSGIAAGADLSNIPSLVRLWLKDPEWFSKKSSESWETFIDRVSTQVRGLGTKTATFGGVWQDPAKAMASAIDRKRVGS